MASAIALGTQSVTAAADYDVIEVSRGETYRKSLSNGETWENKLIDITASGAGYNIKAGANDWTIRNIGVRGQWDHDPGSQQFVAYVPNSGSTGRIENCYFGDGASGSDPGGLFVHTKHEGTLTIDGFNVQDMGDNGIYASSPGYDGDGTGGQGEVHIKNSYAAGNRSSGFRLGSTGSTIENSSMWNNDRGLWCLFQHIEATDCNMGDNGTDVRVGSNSQESGGPFGELTVSNTRYSSTDVVRSQNAIHGSSSGSPKHRGPADVGAPTSAEAAAAGNGTDGTSGSNETSTDEETDESMSSHLLAFVTSPDAYNDTYSFVAAGDVEKATADYDTPSGNSIGANGNDTIDVADGTTTVEGLTGNGYGDAYRVHGPVTSITIDNPDAMWVELDGEAMSTDEVIDVTAESSGDGSALENRILINGVGTTGESRYEFDVTGEIERSTYQGASIDGDMTIEDGHVSGAVTGWRDAFAYSGDLENVSLEGDARVEVNGEQIDTDDYGDALPRVLTIVGNGSRATYQVSVDGIIEPVVWDEADDSVTVDSGQAEGSIERGVQRFGFSGSVTDLTFIEGTAHVYADRDRIVPDDFSG